VSTLNEQLVRASQHHRVYCEEGPHRIWQVWCGECLEMDPRHPNRGNLWTRAAPGGEEQAIRMALDHLSKVGYVPQRLASKDWAVTKPRNTYE
jgi:hypothetical protein